MALTSLSQLGRIEKEISVNEALKIKVHTLSVSEQQRALVSLPDNVENEVAKYTFLQAAILTQAIHEINGEKVTADQTKELLDNMQYNLMAYIFAEYTTLSGEQGKVLDELKKK